jgi:hypothetical protein
VPKERFILMYLTMMIAYLGFTFELTRQVSTFSVDCGILARNCHHHGANIQCRKSDILGVGTAEKLEYSSIGKG